MRRYLVALLLLGTFSYTFAQVVNIEKKRINKEEDKFKGEIDFSTSFVKNTSEVIQGKNDFRLYFQEGKSMFLLINHIGLGQLDGEKFINEGFQHLRYNYSVSNGFITAEAFVQYQYNSIKILKRRFLAGLGPRLRILNRDSLQLFFGPITMFETELLSDDEQTTLNTVRLSCYLSMVYNVNGILSISHITYYQPDYTFFNDYRINSETDFNLTVSKKFIFKIAFNIMYDEMPPEGIPNLFYTLSNGISFNF